MQQQIWTNPLLRLCAGLASALTLAVCSINKEETLPHGEANMLDVWQQGTTSSIDNNRGRLLLSARQTLQRPIDPQQAAAINDQVDCIRTAGNEVHSQLKRLPNLNLAMYMSPHLTDSDPAPVPGYTTVFPFCQRVQYAMPGERTEDYWWAFFKPFCTIAHNLSRYRQTLPKIQERWTQRPRRKRLSTIWRDWPPWVFLCLMPGARMASHRFKRHISTITPHRSQVCCPEPSTRPTNR